MENYLNEVGSELLKEYIQVSLTSKHLPSFWKQLQIGELPHDVCIISIVSDALARLIESISKENVMKEMGCLYPTTLVSRVVWNQCVVDNQFVRVLTASIPDYLFPLMKQIVHEILKEYCNQSDNHYQEECSMDMEVESEDILSNKWSQSQKLLEMLLSMNLINTFLVHPVASIIKEKIYTIVNEESGQVYDVSMLKDTVTKINTLLEQWLQLFFKDITNCSIEDWKTEMLHHLYNAFGRLRVSQLFDIIVEFPDSLPAIHDLKECLTNTNLRNYLKTSLKAQFSRRLLHPGANTADILTHYISSIRALQILDPSGVVLENVCDSVRTYLRTREDTVFCIMASLTDESCNELSEELARGQSLLLDLSEECDDENQDFDAWEPDPIDADPTKTSKSRQTSDIISILVNIYGSQDTFVSEYRHLLADRLLQTLSYDTSRELRNLELLKLRFGEASLHFCDVMLKDVADSRRINAHIHTQLDKNPLVTTNDGLSEMELNSFVLSHVFWPSFKGDKLKPPHEIQQMFDCYTDHFKSLKGMRTLEWCNNLGVVELELVLGEQVNTFTVTPPRAILIWYFQDQDLRSVEELCTLTESQPAIVRKHLSFWVSQGVLREGPTDTFTIASDSTDISGRNKNEMSEEESDTVLTGNQKDSENDEMLWSYISAMLTNLGAMPLERIDTMLKMFMTEGKECSPSELKIFLNKKVKGQQLVFTAGTYQLN